MFDLDRINFFPKYNKLSSYLSDFFPFHFDDSTDPNFIFSLKFCTFWGKNPPFPLALRRTGRRGVPGVRSWRAAPKSKQNKNDNF